MLTKRELKYYSSLNRTKYRKIEQKFMVEGSKLVGEALNSYFDCEVIIANESFAKKFPDLLNGYKHKTIVQTISDFPLVEAINQNIVKSPVLPDEKSRSQLKEKISSKFTERYREFIGLGVHEWKLQYDEFKTQKMAETETCDRANAKITRQRL